VRRQLLAEGRSGRRTTLGRGTQALDYDGIGPAMRQAEG
jgi:hypothetical protein